MCEESAPHRAAQRQAEMLPCGGRYWYIGIPAHASYICARMNVQDSSSGLSSYQSTVSKRQIQNSLDPTTKEENIARLQLETKNGCHETKFVLVTQEQHFIYSNVTVKLVRYYYMSFVTEIKSTQTNEEWLASVRFENDRLAQIGQELMDLDLKFKFEGVMFQFIGEVGDYLTETGATNGHLNRLDRIVEQILPKHTDMAEFAIYNPDENEMYGKSNPYRPLSKGRPSIFSKKNATTPTITRQPSIPSQELLRPPTPGFILAQNSMVTISFLSLEGLRQAVLRGEQLRLEKTRAHQIMKSQLEWCTSRYKTHLTADDVIYLSEKNMRMHMDRDEIEKAMHSGKVYMVMAGLKQSAPGENSKIIIPYNLVRKHLLADIEVPTYNSSSVNYQNEYAAHDNTLCMRNNSVNYHVHFREFTPSSNSKMLLMGSYAHAPLAAAGCIPRFIGVSPVCPDCVFGCCRLHSSFHWCFTRVSRLCLWRLEVAFLVSLVFHPCVLTVPLAAGGCMPRVMGVSPVCLELIP